MRVNVLDRVVRDTLINHFRRRDAQATKRYFFEALETASSVAVFTTLYRYVPAIFQNWERQQAWLRLHHRMGQVPALSETKQIVHLKLGIKLCVQDYKGFVTDYQTSDLDDNPESFLLRHVVEMLTTAPFPNFERRKIFCIGLSRTGTSSVHEATRILGLPSAHFINPITRVPLSDPDFYLFDALSDTPVCVEFEKLYYRFPNALFVMTNRPLPDWVRSMKTLSLSMRATDDFQALKQQFHFGSRYYLPRYGLFDYELYYQYKSLETAFTIYNERVDRFFTGGRESRLLRLDLSASDNWQALCRFLSMPEPSVPFPRVNTAQDVTSM